MIYYNKRHIILALIVLSNLTLMSQNVSNVTAEQKGKRIVVSYSLDTEANTYLGAYINGVYRRCNSVSGDVGENISSGRRTIVWDVLSDMDKVVGEVTFEVHASKSTRSIAAAATAAQKQKIRNQRMKGIYPLAGFDVNGGAAGIGMNVYWPWVTSHPSRVGSYFGWTMGLADWTDDQVDMFNTFCLGATFQVSKHVALFAAPGFSMVDRHEYYTEWVGSSYYGSNVNRTRYITNYQFAAEAGMGYKFTLFMLSFKFGYPYYLGFGLGLDFGWLY